MYTISKGIQLNYNSQCKARLNLIKRKLIFRKIHGMDDSCRVSEVLYVGLCDNVGTPTEVTVRREVRDMAEMIKKPAQIHLCYREMESGSHREGFRFKSSDRDIMFWFTHHKVITDISQSSVYDLSKHTIILMEDTDTPPGFVRLQLLTSQDGDIDASVIQFSDGMYISNLKRRQIMLTTMVEDNSYSDTKSHGPCASGVICCIEVDVAECFHCSYWSRLTCYWRKRCTLHNWPPNHVFDDILRNGCHFVSVGSKMAAAENELEWRMSFSQAEQKLVYSLNHTQFLCYGLLKIFLTEIVNRDIKEPFLCSYFMKTTMFWLVQTGNISWCPNNLLDCFWNCFKYLIDCVHRGVLPNFFIPQNNMFASKLATVSGVRARECLLKQLDDYYEMGVTCLLQQSPTVRKMMVEPVLSNSLIRIEPLLRHTNSSANTDVCIKNELNEAHFPQKDIQWSYFMLRNIIILSNQSLTVYEALTLQQCTADVLVQVAFMYLNNSTKSANKKIYITNRLIGNLLKLAGRVGDVSCLFYLALYYYRTSRYRETLHVTARVKSRLTQPYIMCSTVDQESYNECVAGWSLSKRMRKAWLNHVRLDNDVYYMFIQELDLERRVGLENGKPLSYISPFVLTEMLSVLCNYRLGNRSQCLQSLIDLQTLLLYDDGRYVPLYIRDLSWQILGVCQHVVGDLHGALQSYQQSLSQIPFHKIQNATKYRIAFILNRFSERK